MLFQSFDFIDFWEDSEYATTEYIEKLPTDEVIAAIQQNLQYKLPQSYIWLMKQHNGGIPKNTRFIIGKSTNLAESHILIEGIMGIGRIKSYSLCGSLGTRFMIEEWGYPDIGVAICTCPSHGHSMVFLDYRTCGRYGNEPKVVYVDQENDYKIIHLADDFEAFICGLRPDNGDEFERKSDSDLGIVSSSFSVDFLEKLRNYKE